MKNNNNSKKSKAKIPFASYVGTALLNAITRHLAMALGIERGLVLFLSNDKKTLYVETNANTTLPADFEKKATKCISSVLKRKKIDSAELIVVFCNAPTEENKKIPEEKIIWFYNLFERYEIPIEKYNKKLTVNEHKTLFLTALRDNIIATLISLKLKFFVNVEDAILSELIIKAIKEIREKFKNFLLTIDNVKSILDSSNIQEIPKDAELKLAELFQQKKNSVKDKRDLENLKVLLHQEYKKMIPIYEERLEEITKLGKFFSMTIEARTVDPDFEIAPLEIYTSIDKNANAIISLKESIVKTKHHLDTDYESLSNELNKKGKEIDACLEILECRIDEITQKINEQVKKRKQENRTHHEEDTVNEAAITVTKINPNRGEAITNFWAQKPEKPKTRNPASILEKEAQLTKEGVAAFYLYGEAITISLLQECEKNSSVAILPVASPELVHPHLTDYLDVIKNARMLQARDGTGNGIKNVGDLIFVKKNGTDLSGERLICVALPETALPASITLKIFVPYAMKDHATSSSLKSNPKENKAYVAKAQEKLLQVLSNAAQKELSCTKLSTSC